MTSRPLVGVSCCRRLLTFGDYPPLPHQVVFEPYLTYVAERLGATPLLVPAGPEPLQPSEAERLVGLLDGLLLTGSPSNVGVRRGADGEAVAVPVVGQRDPERDATTLALVTAALGAGLPTLGICRGLQEINVALGGDLHQEVHAVAPHRDHRSDKSRPALERYEPAHAVGVVPGSRLGELLRRHGVRETRFSVNSLHGQAASQLGEGVTVEAVSDDGVVEAIGVAGARGFVLGVQWHIEWHRDDWTLDRCITSAFREACCDRSRTRTAIPAP